MEREADTLEGGGILWRQQPVSEEKWRLLPLVMLLQQERIERSEETCPPKGYYKETAFNLSSKRSP